MGRHDRHAQPSFGTAMSDPLHVSDLVYEIATGQRCIRCHEKSDSCACAPVDDSRGWADKDRGK